MPAIPAALLSVVCSVVAQLLVKKGIDALGNVDFTIGMFRAYTRIFTSPFVLAGTGVYVGAILLWLYSLSKLNLSVAYPLVSVSYVLAVLGAWIFLGEQVPPMRWIGVGVVCVGVSLIGVS